MHVEISEGIRSVLIVEDEMIVAMMMEDVIRELGVRDVHLCPDVASALEIMRNEPIDCAILDLWLRDRDTMEIADALAEKSIPFLFSSGSDASALAPRHASRPMISKPFADDDLKLIVLDTWSLAHAEPVLDGHSGLGAAMSRPTDC